MAMSVQSHLLDITVIGCRNLKGTERISKQDHSYVILEYAGNKYQTRTDGGRKPTFNEKYILPLIEGFNEINVTVWNSNKLGADGFIGSGKILLQKVLTKGYHNSKWRLTTSTGRRAGKIRVILHYTNPKDAHSVTCLGVPQPPSSDVHCTPLAYPASSAYVPLQPAGQSPYTAHGAGGYVPPLPHGAHPSYTYLPESYPPQAYPPYLPQGHLPPYSAP